MLDPRLEERSERGPTVTSEAGWGGRDSDGGKRSLKWGDPLCSRESEEGGTQEKTDNVVEWGVLEMNPESQRGRREDRIVDLETRVTLCPY